MTYDTRNVLSASRYFLAKTKSAAEGVWRTTEDGSRIFIEPGGTVRGGGPNGPVLGNGRKSPKNKKIPDYLRSKINSQTRKKIAGVYVLDSSPPLDASAESDVERLAQEFPWVGLVSIQSTDYQPGILASKDKWSVKFNSAHDYTDGFWEKINKDWSGLMIADDEGKQSTRAVIVHEFGHMLDNKMLADFPGSHKEWMNYIRQEIKHDGAPAEKWELDTLDGRSFYSQENIFEFTAEAFTDWFYNRENASESARKLGEIITRIQ